MGLDKEIYLLDEERKTIRERFDDEPEGTVEKGELLLEFIRLTEERIKLLPMRQDKIGLKALKTFYNLGLKKRKWLKRKKN